MICHDEELAPPCLEALLAGTFALMTCWATPAEDGQPAAASQRALMARKIISNLLFLKNHPHASPGLRQVMARAHARWVPLANTDPACQGEAQDSDAQQAAPAGGLLH